MTCSSCDPRLSQAQTHRTSRKHNVHPSPQPHTPQHLLRCADALFPSTTVQQMSFCNRDRALLISCNARRDPRSPTKYHRALQKTAQRHLLPKTSGQRLSLSSLFQLTSGDFIFFCFFGCKIKAASWACRAADSTALLGTPGSSLPALSATCVVKPDTG